MTAWLLSAGIIAATLVALRLEGQAWWCACGRANLWVGDPWGGHCSKHLADPYTLTHISHGLIFFGLLAWLRPRWSMPWRLCVTIAVEAAWEAIENSAMVIHRFRTHTISADSVGDSVANSMGDIAACIIGFGLAQRLGWRASLAIFVLLEAALAILIRDNLILTVVMSIHPFEAIKSWQMAGHGGGAMLW
jgi:hypothetical protein